MPSARMAMLQVHEALGFTLSPKKAVPCRLTSEGAIMPSTGLQTGVSQGVALGVEFNWNVTPIERSRGVLVKVRIPSFKAIRYENRVVSVVSRRRMSSAEARKMSGTVDYISSAAAQKMARAFAKPLRDWESSGRIGRRPLTTEMLVALQSLIPFFRNDSWNPILGHAVARRFAILFSDARGRGEWGSEKLAAILIMAVGGAYTAIDASSVSIRDWLQHVQSEQRINEWESIAALLALATFSSILEGVDVLHFVDSQAAQGILIKGYSKSATLSAVTSAYWTLAGKCRASI
jgi:hypothetical protein